MTKHNGVIKPPQTGDQGIYTQAPNPNAGTKEEVIPPAGLTGQRASKCAVSIGKNLPQQSQDDDYDEDEADNPRRPLPPNHDCDPKWG